MNAFYFDNEDFIGAPIYQVDDDINFDWNGDSPIEKINHENFSIRWQGFLAAPVTGEYTFTTITDDGNELYLNGNKILTHNMGSVGNPKKTWMEAMHAEPDAM